MNKKLTKPFATNKISKKRLRRAICKLAYDLGVKHVRFTNKARYISGSYNASQSNIYVDGKMDKREILLAFFHELSHHVCYSQGKWHKYHDNAATPLLSATTKFKIENKIDRNAKRLWFKYVDIKEWGRYRYGYPLNQKKYIVEWLERYY